MPARRKADHAHPHVGRAVGHAVDQVGETVGDVGDRILERIAHVHVTPPRRERWVRLLPVVGLGVGVLAAAFLGWVWLAHPRLILPLMLGIPTLFVAGKEAAIPVSLAALLAAGGTEDVGLHAVLVAANMILVDVAGTLVLFPLVHYALDSLERRRGFVGRMMRGAVRRAEKRRHIVDRYGTVGLYLFSIVPFAFNGPPIVAALGRLAGLRAGQVVPVLVAAIVTTSVAWTVIYSVGFTALEHLPTWIPAALSVTVMVLMLTIAALGARKDRSEAEGQGGEATAGEPAPGTVPKAAPGAAVRAPRKPRAAKPKATGGKPKPAAAGKRKGRAGRTGPSPKP